MARVSLIAWPHNGGLYQSAAGVSLRVGEVVEVPEQVAAYLRVSLGAYLEEVPGQRMSVADALTAGGVSDKVIGRLEVAGLVGPALLVADEAAIMAVKGLGKSAAGKVLAAVAVLK